MPSFGDLVVKPRLSAGWPVSGHYRSCDANGDTFAVAVIGTEVHLHAA